MLSESVKKNFLQKCNRIFPIYCIVVIIIQQRYRKAWTMISQEPGEGGRGGGGGGGVVGASTAHFIPLLN